MRPTKPCQTHPDACAGSAPRRVLEVNGPSRRVTPSFVGGCLGFSRSDTDLLRVPFDAAGSLPSTTPSRGPSPLSSQKRHSFDAKHTRRPAELLQESPQLSEPSSPSRSVRWEATQDVLDDAIEKHSPMPSMSARSPEQDVEALIADFNEQNARRLDNVEQDLNQKLANLVEVTRALTLLWDERFERIEVRSPTCSDDVRRIESVTSFVSSETVSHLHEQFLQQALPPRDLSTEMAELRAQFSSHVVQFERAIEGLENDLLLLNFRIEELRATPGLVNTSNLLGDSKLVMSLDKAQYIHAHGKLGEDKDMMCKRPPSTRCLEVQRQGGMFLQSPKDQLFRANADAE